VKNYLRTGLIVFVVFVIVSAQAAMAEDYTRIDLSDSTIGFSSPGNAYGPWIFQDLRAVWVTPGQSALNFEAAHEANGDIIFPTHGEYFAAGYTRDLNRRVWVWGQFGQGTDRPYARTDVHIEAAYKTTPDLKLQMNAAEDFVNYWSGQNLKLFQVGPTYYYDWGVIQARYMCAANSGAKTESGVLAAWDITPTYRQKYTITGLFGPQNFLVGIPGLPISVFNSVGYTYNVWTEQQLGRTGPNGLRWGAKLGGFLTHQTNATTGGPLYTGRGLTLGLWTTFPQ
jgi:hypothetical protein